MSEDGGAGAQGSSGQQDRNSSTNQVIAGLAKQRGTMTRWTRALMILEAVALAVLGATGVYMLLSSGQPTEVVAGFRFGLVAAVGFLVTALAIAIGCPWPQKVLRRVALALAIVYAAAFVAGGVLYPGVGTMWETNTATAALFAGLAVAAFAEFVLLNADVFDPEPGSVP